MVPRWDDLSSSVANWHDKQTNESFVAGRFATILGNSFAAYVGAPSADFLTFFEYTPDKWDQDRDEFSTAANGFAAVSPSLDGRWQFGLGIILERAPNARPRFSFRWPMFITLGDHPRVDVSDDKNISFDLLGPDGQFNLEPICEAMFLALRGLLLAKEPNRQSRPRIGFSPV